MENEGGSSSRSRLRLNAVWKKKNDAEQESKMLIGKVVADKGINKKSIIATIRKGWNMGDDTEIVEMNDDPFVFTFSNLKDKYRMLRGRPWTIQGALMSIQEWSEYMVLSEVRFDKSPFWIQFHNLPLGLLEVEENICNMGNMVGNLVWYEKPKLHNKFSRSFGRARVLIDINKPLVAGFWMDRLDDSEVWVSVKYERLHSYCYKCGLIGHDNRACKRETITDENGDNVYGSWLIVSAEWDKDEAMVKFSVSWNEEDCRLVVLEGDPHTPKSREGRTETVRYGKGSNDGKEISAMQKRWTDKKGAPLATNNLATPTKTAEPATMITLDREEESWRNKEKAGQKKDGLNMVNKAQNGGCRTNPVVQKRLNILDDLGCNVNKQRAPLPMVRDDNGFKPAKELSKAIIPTSQLSPISDMAKRLNGFNLKRSALDPVSPGPCKKRGLFTEGKDESEMKLLVSSSSKKKSVRKVKNELRTKSRENAPGLVEVPISNEIDFPDEWFVFNGNKKSNVGTSMETQGSGGCPSSATNEP